MTYISPKIRSKFDSLSIDLKKKLWSRNLCLYGPQDLAEALQIVAKEAEQARPSSLPV